MKTIKGQGYYWVMLCEDLICGVFATKKEAQEANEFVKDCFIKHKIKRCKVEIKL
jgi:hypothetical protein